MQRKKRSDCARRPSHWQSVKPNNARRYLLTWRYMKKNLHCRVRRMQRSWKCYVQSVGRKAELQQAKDAQLSAEGMERLERKHQEELDAIAKQYADERAEQQKADEERLDQAEMSQRDRQINAVESRYDELIELAEKYGRDTTKLEAQRQAELDKIRGGGADKEIKELTALYELERELQLLSMDDRTAKFERERDDANALSQGRVKIAEAGFQKEKEQLIAQGLDTTELENQHALLLTDIRQRPWPMIWLQSTRLKAIVFALTTRHD